MRLRRSAGALSRALRVLLVAVGLLALGGVGAAVGAYFMFLRDLPDLQSLDDYRPALASRVVDRHGTTIGQFFSERRRLTPFASVPPHVVNAFVAGEDSAFFEHEGIDFSSILRAAWVNLRTGGEIKQGGSTITQQMVKGLLLSPERTYRRKIRELILARNIERHLTKQEILYLYLNQIYFGHGAYGIGEAAQTYFGKDVSALSVSEGAQLAGLPKAPSHYSPFANPEAAEQRRRYVLDRMLEEKLIDASTHDAAVAEVPRLRELSDEDHVWEMAYFTEEVRRELFTKLGGDVVLRGGLVVETTLDAELQRTAVAALRRGLVELDERQAYRGPLRKVATAAIPEELAKLALENGFAKPPAAPEAGADAEAAANEVAAAAPTGAAAAATSRAQVSSAADAAAWVWPMASRKGARPIDPRGGAQPLVGVVTKVDREAQSARVAFAPGHEAEVKLEDVAWAREPDPDAAPHPVGSIDQVFHRGDVARFVPVAAASAGRGRPAPASRDALPGAQRRRGAAVARRRQRRGARARGRLGFRPQSVRPRDASAPPAGLGVQADHLRRGAREGLHRFFDPLRPPGRLRRRDLGLRLAPAELRQELLWTDHDARGPRALREQRDGPSVSRRRRRLRDLASRAGSASRRRSSATSRSRSARARSRCSS